MKRKKVFFLISILIIACVLRLYRSGNPIADWHSWRQADTSAVSRNFVLHRFDVLHPMFDDLSNVPSGLDNPHGYRFVEFPIYNIFQAGLFTLFGVLTLEAWGRIVSILASCLSILFIFGIVRKYANEQAGLFAAFFFASIPFSIYYGRVILPDPLTAAMILGGIYFFDKWVENSLKIKVKSLKFFLALVFTSAAFLLKPYALFFALPMVAISYNKFGFSFLKKWQLWLFAIVALAPLVFWRYWMTQYPEGIPVSAWLFNGGNIRFKGAFFYWIFADRIGRLILGYWGIAIIAFGFVRNKKRESSLVFNSFLLSSLLYITVIARGNVQHDYYQILILPTLAIFLGIGADFLWRSEYFSKISARILLVVCVLFMVSFGWYNIRDYFNINNEKIVIAGRAVAKLIPKDAKVIAPYDGDTSFLYQTERRGWASFEKSLPEMVKMGADYLVLLNPKEEDFTGIGSMYKVVSKTADYVLFDLHTK